ncbi:MAG: peptidylprolyl isomerase [Bacteroidales bacterium]|nr:peptidylprolyl isomerase [Bacteroidales bacterium]
MEVASNKVVTLTYELKLDSAEGDVVEQVDKDKPFVFLHGAGNMLPAFEEKLKGKQEGDKFEFTLSKDEAYGDPSDEAIIDLPKNVFEVEGKIDENLLQVGNYIPMQDQQGNRLDGQVKEVGDDKVKMDFNHPMAGQNLHFIGEIVEVREPSEEEINHGHAHGPEGHQ